MLQKGTTRRNSEKGGNELSEQQCQHIHTLRVSILLDYLLVNGATEKETLSSQWQGREKYQVKRFFRSYPLHTEQQPFLGRRELRRGVSRQQ